MKSTPLREFNKTERLAFSVAETAQLLGISQTSVRRLLDRGLIKASKVLRHKMIPKSQIEMLLNETL